MMPLKVINMKMTLLTGGLVSFEGETTLTESALYLQATSDVIVSRNVTIASTSELTHLVRPLPKGSVPYEDITSFMLLFFVRLTCFF